MTVSEAVEKSISAAIAAGKVDADGHAAALQALRALAAKADLCSEKDNVTFPTLLKYLAALGMLPDVEPAKAQRGEPLADRMEAMRGKFAAFQGGRTA